MVPANSMVGTLALGIVGIGEEFPSIESTMHVVKDVEDFLTARRYLWQMQ